MNVVWRGRKVSIDRVESHTKAYADVYVEAATWEDTGEDLTDMELDALADDHADAVMEIWQEKLIGAAEDAADLAADR